MIQTVKSLITKPSPPPPISPVSGGIRLGLLVAVSLVAILSVNAVSAIAQAVVLPLVYSVGIGIAAHIILYGPKESIECVKPLIKKIPGAVREFFTKAPSVIERMSVSMLHLGKKTYHFIETKAAKAKAKN
jgi:hypothetical protein